MGIEYIIMETIGVALFALVVFYVIPCLVLGFLALQISYAMNSDDLELGKKKYYAALASMIKPNYIGLLSITKWINACKMMRTGPEVKSRSSDG